MKHIIIFITFFLFFSLSIYATETTQDTSINTLIKKIKQSSSEDRHVLINKLKVILRKMNQETRKKVMQDLQRSFVAQKVMKSTQKTSKASSNPNSALRSTQQSSMQQRSATQIPQRSTFLQNGQPKGPKGPR